jgi:hypothetical protein
MIYKLFFNIQINKYIISSIKLSTLYLLIHILFINNLNLTLLFLIIILKTIIDDQH